MPGIVCVLGGAEPAARARRGAVPLARRAHHRLDLAEAVDEGLAMLFCGEVGGTARDEASAALAAVDGELLSDEGVVAAREGASVLLDSYLRAGDAFEPPEGWYAGAIWDPRSRQLLLVSDRFGQRPLYVARIGGALVAASELKSLLAAGLPPELDLQGWAEMLAFEYPLADSTPLAGVESLPQASILAVSADGRRRLREYWRYRVEPAESIDESDFLDELDGRLERAVSRRLAPGTALALSSGLDSRTLAAFVRRLAPATLAVTYGARGSEDLTGGGQLAERAGFPRREYTLEPGYIARGAAETVWLAEGHVRCFHGHHLALRSLRADDGISGLLVGFGGDIVMRGHPPPGLDGTLPAATYKQTARCVTDELIPILFEEPLAGELAGLARRRLLGLVEAESGSPLVRIQQFSFQSNRRQMLWGTELFRDDLVARDPFHDADVVDHCRLIPEELRIDGILHRAYLRRYPDLASVLNPKDGLPAHLVGRRREAAAVALRARRGARKALYRARGRRFVPRRAGIGDYANDLRGESRGLLDILLEPRTLARGQLREDGVRRLVDETLAGRLSDTRAAGMLLTFELFQRQFIEGEQPS